MRTPNQTVTIQCTIHSHHHEEQWVTIPLSSIIVNCSLTRWYHRKWVLEELFMSWNIMAALILASPFFIFFVAAPHPFGVIVTFFIGIFLITGGRFSQPVSQIMTLLSLLLYGRPTPTTNFFFKNLEFLFYKSSLCKAGAYQDVWSVNIFHLLGASTHNCFRSGRLYLLLS